MALKLNERYPGRFNNPNANYPQGSFKNRSAPGAKDGSYLEKDWANDKEGFFQKLLSAASITPNGSVDTVLSGQYYDGLIAAARSTLPKRTFSKNDFIRIPDVPGGLIIQWGIVTVPQSSNISVTFPVANPSQTLHVFATMQQSINTPTPNSVGVGVTPTLTGATIYNMGASGQAVTDWLAIGY